MGMAGGVDPSVKCLGLHGQCRPHTVPVAPSPAPLTAAVLGVASRG